MYLDAEQTSHPQYGACSAAGDDGWLDVWREETWEEGGGTRWVVLWEYDEGYLELGTSIDSLGAPRPADRPLSLIYPSAAAPRELKSCRRYLSSSRVRSSISRSFIRSSWARSRSSSSSNSSMRCRRIAISSALIPEGAPEYRELEGELPVVDEGSTIRP